MKQYTITTKTIVSGNTPEEALEKFAQMPVFDDKNNIQISENIKIKGSK